MASSVDFIEFVLDSLSGIRGEIRYKKMFGEYCVYVNDKPVILVCDDTVYLKMLPAIEHLMAQAKTQPPYNGAKPHYILDIENRDLTIQVVELLEQNTPLPKPRKPKKKL